MGDRGCELHYGNDLAWLCKLNQNAFSRNEGRSNVNGEANKENDCADYSALYDLISLDMFSNNKYKWDYS